jgi:cytochrome c biogenesis protein CcmG/thiol:disulfide interchange protein DsbE
MPEVNRLKEKYKNSDIVFMAITYETKKQVIFFLKKKKFDFRIISDAKEYCDIFTDNYPINIFADRDGIIKNIQYGMPFQYDVKTKTHSTKG